jgi:hypothetical protein
MKRIQIQTKRFEPHYNHYLIMAVHYTNILLIHNPAFLSARDALNLTLWSIFNK